MTNDGFRVEGIDHVELTVPDRYEAAEWYNEALGLEVVADYEDWADVRSYPLMVSSNGGDTMLALFEGQPSRPRGGFRRVAFRVSADGFLSFLDRIASIPEIHASRKHKISDLGRAYSVFFSDPYGHPFEVTTYDYDIVSDESDLV